MNAEWENLKSIVADVLKQAKTLGADAAEASVSYASGLSTTVRMGETDTIEFNRDKSLDITVFKGKKKGSVSTSDIRKEAILSSLEAACRIATYTEEDPAAGLADESSLAKQIPDLDLYHPFTVAPEQAVLWAKECEERARRFDTRIINSEGATFSTQNRYYVYGNTQGFLGAYPSTLYTLYCTVIAKANEGMQRDYDYTIARDMHELESRIAVGQNAALRTLRRLNARKMKTCEAPVIFSAEIAGSLLNSFIAAISGANLYRKSSFLVDHLEKAVFPAFVHLQADPHLSKGLGSAPFDQEGVETKRRLLVEAGVLKSYVLSSYSARKLGLKTTGNAGGIHNLMISHGDHDLPDLIKAMGTGLLVTELMGHGINLVTGDYSRGASGFWVENGEIQYPVQEITIAGNLKEMFKHLVAVGNDIDHRSNILTGSLWLHKMTIAGS